MNRTGYCCINLSIGESFKTMQLGRTNKAPGQAAEKWEAAVKHNFNLLEKIVKWNMANNVFLYRISSDMIPFADHDDWGYLWKDALEDGRITEWCRGAREALDKYREFGGRLSIHPAQFVSISSPNKETIRKSIANLNYHGDLLDVLNLPNNYDCPINIHISNGSKGSIVVDTVYNTLNQLNKNVTRRLVFENEQYGYWTPNNIRTHFKGIPITFDYHHYLINPDKDDQFTLDEVVKFTSESWPNNDPIQHWSEGRTHEKDISHSDFITRLPDTEYDIEVEAKKKDLSIMPYLRKRNMQISNILY